MRTCLRCSKEITTGSKSGLCRSCVHIGQHHSEESIDRMRAKKMGKKRPAEVCAKISAGKKAKNHPYRGKHLPPEHCAKMSASRMGIRHSPESYAKQGIKMKGNTNGKGKRSSETCTNISIAMKGKPSNRKGMKLPADTIAKMSAAGKCKTFSPEHRANMRTAAHDRIISAYGTVRLGKHETELLDLIEQQKAIKIKRDFTIIGYYPDGYDVENNCICEVYEPYHFKQVKEDLERQKNIQETLKCSFSVIYDQDAAKKFTEN